MRAVIAVGLVLVALGAGTLITAQTKRETKETSQPGPKVKPKTEATQQPASLRATLAHLQMEINTQPLRNGLKFSVALEIISDALAANGRDVTILIDQSAFREEESGNGELADTEFRIGTAKAKAPVLDLLRHAVRQMPGKAALRVRGGEVEIVPLSRTTKEYMLNQTFFVDFKERALDLALEELSDRTGVSIVLDARAKQKAQMAVTARFLDDVALQDAVRMLTDMADLKVVYLVTGLYITTPEHAKEMQKELKNLYEPKVPAGPAGTPGAPPDPNQMEPFLSPLAPPLPPLFRKRLDPAA